MTSTPDAFGRALAIFGEHVSKVGDDRWRLPTPCTDWDVRALVNHLVYENRWMPPLFEGRSVADVGNAFDGDLLGDDPKGAWTESAARALAAVLGPGAMERTVHLSRGPARGELYAFEVFTDLLVHGWDLARSIGDDETLDPELIEVCYARMEPIMAALKRSGQYGPTIEPPRGSDRQTILLALFGRVA